MKKNGKKWLAVIAAAAFSLSVMTACGASNDSASADSASAMAYAVSNRNYSAAETEEAYAQDSLGMNEGYSEETITSDNQLQESDVASQQSSRKLIRTVNMSVETKEFDSVMVTLEQRVAELGGYMESMDTYNGSVYSSYRSSRSASMTVRIPQDKLSTFLSEMSEISNVIRRSENVEDVTLSYVDLESHKKTLQAEHERLLELMERAEYIEDIISIEQRLSQVQYQIESMESQLRTYDNKVDYGTVYLDISEVQELTPVQEATLWERITGGFMEDLQKIGNGALEIVIWLLTHIPTLLLCALILFLFILWIRGCQKRGRKKAAKKAEQSAAMHSSLHTEKKEENTHE